MPAPPPTSLPLSSTDWPAQLFAAFQAPLSGAVTQWIRAWGEAVGQVGLLNVNIDNSGNPELERQITSSYSYGRQLGRMLDVLLPLVQQNEAALREAVGDQRVDDFVAMARSIEARKHLSVDDIVAKVRTWERSDRYATDLAELIERLRALQAIAGAPAGEDARPQRARAKPSTARRGAASAGGARSAR